MARFVLGLLVAASLLSVYTQADSAAEGAELNLVQASTESQRDFLKAISRLKRALEEKRIVQAEVAKRNGASLRPTEEARHDGERRPAVANVAAFATSSGAVALQQVGEKVEHLKVRPRPAESRDLVSESESELAKSEGDADVASEEGLSPERVRGGSLPAGESTEEDGARMDDKLPSAEALIEEAEPNLEKCKLQGQKDPTETLASLKGCTEELKKMAQVTMQAHQGSETANKQYVSKFKEVMSLLKKLEAVHELQTAFNKDHENVRKYLIGEADKLKTPIQALGAAAKGLEEGKSK